MRSPVLPLVILRKSPGIPAHNGSSISLAFLGVN